MAGQGGAVPETMESARRWSGFVCPDCRFVFRVPRDHDGKGVVCPSCRRMLRIPAPGDRTPPLLMPLKSSKPEEPPSGAEPPSGENKRRKKKSRRGENHAWDSETGKRRMSGREDKRQMFWMLVGGATLLALILAGVLMTQLGGDKPVPPVRPLVAKPNDAEPAVREVSDVDFLAAAEPMAKKFLEAGRIEDLVALVRNPKLAEPRIRSQYPDGKVPAPGMSSFNTASEVVRIGSVFSVGIRTRDFEEKVLFFHETPEGFKIDWEAWAGWSELPWAEFMASKTKQSKAFRVNLGVVEYYNVAFADDKKWTSYRLESPDGKHVVYGYAESDSVLNSKLRPPPESKVVGMILALRFPENAASNNQVLIDHIITEGWVLEKEESQ